VSGLYNEGLYSISIRLNPQDNVKLLNMDNFVMNPVDGDYLEGLCNKSFIPSDERTTAEHLARMPVADVA
jgi:hypothetical protein